MNHESIKFMKISLLNSCKQQDMEICAVKLDLTNINTVIISNFQISFRKLHVFS